MAPMTQRIRRTIVCKEFKLLADLLSLRGDEFLLAPLMYSKAGSLSFDNFCKASHRLAEGRIPAVLLWDRIEKDDALGKRLDDLPRWLPFVAAIRIQDPGVAAAIKERHPEVPLQLSLEQNSPNHRSILAWTRLIKPQRLVLSNQFSLALIQSLDKSELPELEIPALGPLEVFYSPRHLISEDASNRQVEAISEERPRQTNSLVQSDAGTLMFHSRDLFLLDQFESMSQAGISWAKIEPRSAEQCQWLASCITTQDFREIKTKWPNKVTRGFFSANRTDRPLKRLVNQSLAPFREQALGQVIEAKKGAHLLIELYETIDLPAQLTLINPEGREVSFILSDLSNLQGQQIKGSTSPGFFLAPWIKGGLARSLLLMTQ